MSGSYGTSSSSYPQVEDAGGHSPRTSPTYIPPIRGYGAPPPIDISNVAQEIERIHSIVIRYFPVHDVRVGYSAIVFRCRLDLDTLDDKFIALKNDLFSIGYIPILTEDADGYALLVTRKPQKKYRSIVVNVVLLCLTILTTVLAGAWAYAMFDGQITIRPEDIGKSLTYFTDIHYLSLGALYFALPLMLILGVHELGHYFMARRHGVAASLPFFMPMPPYPISPLGTMGAFISVREPIPNKKALLDIGVAGPICGFIVAMPVILVGLYLTVTAAHPTPADVTWFFIPGDSLLYFALSSLFPGSNDYMLHPTAFAGWVGLLVTAINLLPAGQLDGGHISHALFGKSSRYFSYGAVGIMLLLGIFTPTWFIFAFIIILLGLRHPPPLNDITKLDGKRRAVGVFSVILLIICFVPSPLTVQSGEYGIGLELMPGEQQNRTAFINSTVCLNFTVTNTGTTAENVSLSASIPVLMPPWTHDFRHYGDINVSLRSMELAVGISKNVTMLVYIPNNYTFMNKSYDIRAEAKAGDVRKHLTFRIFVENRTLSEVKGSEEPHRTPDFRGETNPAAAEQSTPRRRSPMISILSVENSQELLYPAPDHHQHKR